MARRGAIRDCLNRDGVVVAVEARWYDLAGKRKGKRFALDTPGDGKARKRAERAALDFLDRISADKQRGSEVDPNARARFREVAETWLATKHGRPKTLAGYRSLLDKHILSRFGDLPVNRVRTSDVRAWLKELDDAGAAANTIRNAFRVLKPVLDIAVEDGYLATNPASRIKANQLPRSSAPHPEMLFLNAEEVQRLARAADALYPEQRYGVLIEFAAWTGLRSGEIAGLRMRNLDLLRGVVRVRESLSEVGGQLHAVAPKTYAARDVQLLPPQVPRLRAYIAGQPAKGPNDYVFTEPDGSQLRHVGWFYSNVFRKAVTRAGLDPALRFHDLRHTCAALLIADAWHPSAISKRLGHSTITVTMDRYGHLLPSLESELIARSAVSFEQSIRAVGE